MKTQKENIMESKKKYRYETHLHTLPVSKCAKASVRENLECYKALGYDGVFITNHFIDGNISGKLNHVGKGLGMTASYEEYKELIDFYFSDYEEALALSDEIGIKVFDGVEISYKGTDFLVYGLDKDWYLSHPEIIEMTKREELDFMRSEGAFIVHAHPFREAYYIDHIRLFPRSVEAVEVLNACRTDEENRLADQYADNYGFIKVGGTDNHQAMARSRFSGVETEEPIECPADYIRLAREGKIKIFSFLNEVN